MICMAAGPIDLLLSAGPIASSDHEVLGCVISFVDITERKRAAEDRLRLLEAANAARASAEAANRAKDEFLAMLGHELRNPLAPILTALELMDMRDDRHRAPTRAGKRHRAPRSSTSSGWSVICSTCRGSPRARSCSTGGRSSWRAWSRRRSRPPIR